MVFILFLFLFSLITFRSFINFPFIFSPFFRLPLFFILICPPHFFHSFSPFFFLCVSFVPFVLFVPIHFPFVFFIFFCFPLHYFCFSSFPPPFFLLLYIPPPSFSLLSFHFVMSPSFLFNSFCSPLLSYILSPFFSLLYIPPIFFSLFFASFHSLFLSFHFYTSPSFLLLLYVPFLFASFCLPLVISHSHFRFFCFFPLFFSLSPFLFFF